MNWKFLDRARRHSGPVEIDLIEAYAQNKITRRDFVRRGAIIGLSAPFMGAIIAACGGSDGESAATTTSTTAGSQGSGGGAAGGNLIAAIQQGDASSGLDPVNMLDLGTYCVVSQSFEYLVGLGADGNIDSTALATDWSPNEDGSQWTFTLREGPMWSDGTPVTSADVAATMDRLVAQGNAGLGGVIGEGSVDASDPQTCVFTLLEPNGNFPVLVSIFNAQALITPADYTDGTTLDERPEGSGPWILDSFDQTSFSAKYVPNPNWWGGTVNLDSQELRGFAEIGTAVTAMQSRTVDVIQNFSVIGGEGLLNDSNFTVLTPPSSNHRQCWFNVAADSPFSDPRVRQAMAFAIDREQMVNVLFQGRAEIGNDHPIIASLPFYDPSATPQRSKDIEMARQLLSDAGVTSISDSIHSGDLGEIPQLAALIQAGAGEAGATLEVATQSNSTFYEDQWCPALYDESLKSDGVPCGPSSNFGIVDYGHRPVPDIFLSSALATNGVWNSSNFANSDFDSLLSQYRTAVDVEGQKTAIGSIQRLLHEETPALYPYFFNWLAGHDNSIGNIQTTALGHLLTGNATKG